MRPSRYCPHAPHPQQAEFLAVTTPEALYGGAAGGGKSDALLMAALQFVHVRGYSALILRRTYADLALPGAIMDRAREWLSDSDAVWNERDKRFTFPKGSVLQFGYLDTPSDVYRYQSTAFQYIGFDELTQFEERPYLYLFSRLRRLAGSDVPIRMRAATNPGGIGHEWVKARFIEPLTAERPFVPALLDDNPSLDAESYRHSLANLDATTRAQLERGVWIQDSSGLVYSGFLDGRNVIDVAPKCDVHMLGLDFGVVDDCSFTIVGWRKDDPVAYILKSYKRQSMIPSEAAAEAKELESRYKFARVIGDVGGLGKAFAEEARRRFNVPIEAAQKHNKRGYISMMNGELERGLIKVVRSECRELIDEWRKLPWADARLDREADGFDNHCADGALYIWRSANAFLEKVPEPEAQEGTAEYWARKEREMERQAVKAFRGRR
jgi:hypothetical protein